MTAYYNENDPFAAQFLRRLIEANLIAPGEVDERSIEDIRPSDLAGIGLWSYSLRCAGWSDSRPVWTGSCPCQPFSAAGKGVAFDDERHLWPAWFHLIDERRPESVFGEQVASKDGLTWFDLVSDDLEGTGHTIRSQDLCAAGFGAPHIRQRLVFRADRMEHATGFGRLEWRAGADGRGAASGRGLGGLADPDDAGLEGRGQPRRERAAERLAGPGSVAGRVVDSHSDGREPGRSLRPIRAKHDAEHGGAVGRLGNTERDISGRRSAEALGAEDRGRGVEKSGDHGPVDAGTGLSGLVGQITDQMPGPVNGFWNAADWILCRDDKWRAIESGTFPLAHGYPNRMGLLRVYGNAIVPPKIIEFIKATEKG